jgi:hypothetical protein
VLLFRYQQHNIQVASQGLGALELQETVLLPAIAYVPSRIKIQSKLQTVKKKLNNEALEDRITKYSFHDEGNSRIQVFFDSLRT